MTVFDESSNREAFYYVRRCLVAVMDRCLGGLPPWQTG